MSQVRATFQGVFPALPTPFDANGHVNRAALAASIEYNIGKGVDGFYVCGSTGEAFLLSDEERRAVYETAAEAAAGRVRMIAHVGAVSTAAAATFADTARRLGYDAVSAVAPFYYKFSFEQIKAHYYTVAEAAGIPMIIYNIPTFSGVTLSVSQVAQFFCDSGFIGIKHTSNDFFSLEQMRTSFKDKVIFNGYDEMFLAGLSMGADGGIGSTYNFMAEKFLRIRALFSENRMAEAFAVQQEANRIISVLIDVGVIEGVKEVMCQLGFDFGRARAPFSELTKEQKQRISREITDRL